MISYTLPEIISGRAEVGKHIIIEGSVRSNIFNESITGPTVWENLGMVSNDQLGFCIYRNDLEVFCDAILTDENGRYKFESFIPREPGFYKATIMVFYGGEWHLSNLSSYVSEKDTDSDGVPDKYDYDLYDPNVQSRGDVKVPAFEAVFAIVGLLAVAYLSRRRR